MKKKILSAVICLAVLCCMLLMGMTTAYAKGTTYTELNDVYYAKEGCLVYLEPSYTSTVITVLNADVPVRVIGSYSNGWYRINIGVIAYCKMDGLTTAGNIGIVDASDTQAYYARQTADELGYEFHYLKLNAQKTIKKDIFNSYINQKAILFVKLDNNVAISFKMLYADEVESDINLNYKITYSNTDNPNGRITLLEAPEDIPLLGQIAIFQFRTGYDKAVSMNVMDLYDFDFLLMNTYYTEFSEFAYAPVTQISDMMVEEWEITESLTDTIRAKMSNIRKGIKYKSYDEAEYRASISSRLRLDTEYVDYQY